MACGCTRASTRSRGLVPFDGSVRPRAFGSGCHRSGGIRSIPGSAVRRGVATLSFEFTKSSYLDFEHANARFQVRYIGLVHTFKRQYQFPPEAWRRFFRSTAVITHFDSPSSSACKGSYTDGTYRVATASVPLGCQPPPNALKAVTAARADSVCACARASEARSRFSSA